MSHFPEKLTKKLSLAESRLNGNDHCQNCGTTLKGPYCHYCGQPDKNFFRFFPALLREMMGDLLDFDSRLPRTLKPLLFQPGKLARDYMHGRRFRYTSPIRLYMFSSIIFFVLASLMTNMSIQDQLLVEKLNTTQNQREITVDGENKASIKPEKTDTKASNSEIKDSTEDKLQLNPRKDKGSIIRINFDKDGSENVNIPFFPTRLNQWINGELAKSEIKSKAIAEDPTLIVSKVFDMLPMAVFILLPVFALLLKFFYIFSKRYYTEHLIFALYSHSFVFTLATIVLLLNALIQLALYLGWIDKASAANAVLDNTSQLLLLWIPIYFWLALKRFYQQGWFKTSLKFSALGISYLLTLGATTALIAVINFLLL